MIRTADDVIVVTGTVVALDPMDAGTSAGVAVRQADGRTAYVKVRLGGESLLLDRLGGSWTHGRAVELRCAPIPPRLGAPLGEVVEVLPLAA